MSLIEEFVGFVGFMARAVAIRRARHVRERTRNEPIRTHLNPLVGWDDRGLGITTRDLDLIEVGCKRKNGTHSSSRAPVRAASDVM